MKKIVWLSLSILVILSVLALAGCETLTPPLSGNNPAGDGLVLSQQNTGIWVTGEGSVTVVPDIANLSLGVEAEAETVAQAQSEASSAMTAVTGELDAYGVDDKDIKTQRFNIQPMRRWIEEKEEEIITGYRVTNTVAVKVRDVADTGSIIDAVAGDGGDNIRINNISFTVDDPSKYHQEARELAMADAETKAKQLADYAGVRLGTPTYINESGGFIPPVQFAFSEALAIPAPAPPISPGETEIRLTVQVVYAIR